MTVTVAQMKLLMLSSVCGVAQFLNTDECKPVAKEL